MTILDFSVGRKASDQSKPEKTRNIPVQCQSKPEGQVQLQNIGGSLKNFQIHSLPEKLDLCPDKVGNCWSESLSETPRSYSYERHTFDVKQEKIFELWEAQCLEYRSQTQNQCQSLPENTRTNYFAEQQLIDMNIPSHPQTNQSISQCVTESKVEGGFSDFNDDLQFDLEISM
mmetsp:Transcript_16050/g.20923  ORF Transcript_16050/g.20923 Transcript_16050/m.20923 type:complete len:173 (-) Transcript_16050:640-1158(-)